MDQANTHLNIELFKKIRDRIATIPESYDQSDRWSPSEDAPCGTVACLAGEAIICSAPTVEEGIRRLRTMSSKGIARAAADLLGLKGDYHGFPQHEAAIFHSRALSWPAPFREQFEKGEQSAAVIAYLNHIIETGTLE